MSRYEPLTRFLESRRDSQAPLRFSEIEDILDRPLPMSARQHQPWWSNTATHSHADAWMRIGWKTSRVNLAEEKVVFVRDDRSPEISDVATSMATPPSETITIDRAALAGGAIHLLEEYSKERGCSLSEAATGVLNALALERRRQLIEWFRANSPRVPGDSTDIIREARDAR
ncbi:MAG TPA: hypothetical protein VN814_07350 [Caulobacteraceae bacterium]|nr:hypothetical protein [Caulobacteraceae bacterium]